LAARRRKAWKTKMTVMIAPEVGAVMVAMRACCAPSRASIF
jgi:hypothetical protein